MKPGALGALFLDRPNPAAWMVEALHRLYGFDPSIPATPQWFAAAARDYMKEFGAKPETFARITVKSRRHASRNPKAVFRKETTVEEVLASDMISPPVTRFQCCPPTCGAAAAVLCSEEFVRRHGLDARVRLAAISLGTDTEKSIAGDMRSVCGVDIAEDLSKAIYEKAGIGPDDVDVVEMHDCFTPNEFICYEALGLTPRGTAEKFILDGDNTYGGKVVTNPSGGLLSKGHPIGATGMAQCYELVQQLRGQADARQVEGARIGLQHNIGFGSACIVALYEATGNRNVTRKAKK
jgi:acetyl-CoA acetyltransferase